MWSFAEWFPLQTLVGDTMMLHLWMPEEQAPVLFLPLFCTLKKEQKHCPFLLFAHFTLWPL